jgi:uncharacterized protein (TIGR00269 family)
MRCVKCSLQAVIELRRHHSALCAPHYLEFFRNQVARSIHHHRMFTQDDRLLVAVSGGKDSLSLWDALMGMGYQTTGLHIHLGIGEYSDGSLSKTRAFAEAHGAQLIVVDVTKEYGLGVPQLARAVRRVPCSGCGLSKRYIFNKVALDGGYTVLVTGHNLDDEVATLMGNVLHWQTEYLARQAPALESTHPTLVRKAKPFCSLTEREIASYAILRGIDFVEEECPNAEGASSLQYKEVLNQLERQSPGTKQQFLDGFLQRIRPGLREAEAVQLRDCARCGQPTTTEVCAFCRLWERARARAAQPRTAADLLGQSQAS